MEHAVGEYRKNQMNKCDEEITVVDKKDHHRGVAYSHPCFGMIHINRINGCASKLFGSEIEVSNTMRISVEETEVTQDLGRNWYFGHKRIIEVELSPNQYAELISNPNTQGSPCTVRYRADKGQIVPRHIDTVTKYVESEIEKDLSGFSERSSNDLKDINEILGRKGALKVSDRNDISRMINKLVQDLNSNLPFYRDSVLESIDKAKIEAKTEVDSFVAHAIQSAGVAALNDERIVELLLDNKDNSPTTKRTRKKITKDD